MSGIVKGAIIPLSSIAVAAGVHLKTLKRRLKKLDAKHPGLLVRFGDNDQGKIYADLTKLKQLVPAYAPLDPSERVLEGVADLKKSVAEIHVNLAALRDNVAACIPIA